MRPAKRRDEVNLIDDGIVRSVWAMAEKTRCMAVEEIRLLVGNLLVGLRSLSVDSGDRLPVQKLQECRTVRILFLWTDGRLSGIIQATDSDLS